MLGTETSVPAYRRIEAVLARALEARARRAVAHVIVVIILAAAVTVFVPALSERPVIRPIARLSSDPASGICTKELADCRLVQAFIRLNQVQSRPGGPLGTLHIAVATYPMALPVTVDTVGRLTFLTFVVSLDAT